MACIDSRRLNFSASILDAYLTILSSLSSSSSVLMLRGVLLRSVVFFCSEYYQVIPSCVCRSGVICFGFDGAGFCDG